MYVYVMHKREVLLSLSALLSAYILLLFIGLAGPNVDKINSVMAKEMIAESNIQENYTAQLLSYGPFMMITPALSTYSQQLSLHLTFSLKNEESSEAFHKEFDIMIDLDGVSSTNNKTLLCKILFLVFSSIILIHFFFHFFSTWSFKIIIILWWSKM